MDVHHIHLEGATTTRTKEQAMPCHAMSCNAMPCHAKQSKAMQSNAMPSKTCMRAGMECGNECSGRVDEESGWVERTCVRVCGGGDDAVEGEGRVETARWKRGGWER